MSNLPPSPQPAPVPPHEAAAELLRRRRARSSLLDFTTFTKSDYDVNWHHRLIAEYVEKWIAGDIENLGICMPPRHGKTEQVTRRTPAYILGQNPDAAIMLAMHTAALAGDECLSVQSILDGDAYRKLFPGTRIGGKNVRDDSGRAPQRNRDIVEVFERQGFLRAAGVGTAIAGRGFRYGIIDDPYPDQESAESPTQRAAIWRWYSSDFMSRALPNAQVLLCMTRRNIEDLVGAVQALQKDDPRARKWTFLVLPAIRTPDASPLDPRQPGESLWPSRYPLEVLEQKRAENPRDFEGNYQQNPRLPGSTEWPASYFDGPGFWFDDWPPMQELEVRVISLDPSKGTDAKTGDYQARIKYGRDRNNVEYVEADLSHRPMTAPRSADGTQLGEGMIESLVEEVHTFKPHRVALETNQFQILLRIPLDQELERRRIEVTVAEINNTENKNMRIRRLGPPLAKRKIRFKSNSRGTRLLCEQLKQFPLADHDDGPDALEMARRVGIDVFNEGKGG